MKTNKIKFSDLVNDNLSAQELSKIEGGVDVQTCGCDAGICSVKIVTSYCTDGDGICKSGIAGLATPIEQANSTVKEAVLNSKF
ncbi:MAG: TIGR04149 family rSAM-modified RiPP [Dysgonamonadaceae bacterium]|jgi:natural product precursor|nr:TIGR04149 family rSAM-modified RiPP [Dysgonamonadaceae bacterium]